MERVSHCLCTAAGTAVLHVAAAAGDVVELTAAGTSDPDGDAISYRWFVYREAGTYAGEVPIDGSEAEAPRIRILDNAAGRTIHVILEVADDGEPKLFSYRRIVLEVGSR